MGFPAAPALHENCGCTGLSKTPGCSESCAAPIVLAGALTQVFCYRARLLELSILVPVRLVAAQTYDQAAQYGNSTGIDRSGRRAARMSIASSEWF